jgi:hypothetical protein
MPGPTYGAGITTFKRYAKAQNTGQARIPEWTYYGKSFVYDANGNPDHVTAFKNGLLIARYPATHPTNALEIAPFKPGDANLGTPIGVMLEGGDLELDLNTSVYLKGAWDTNIFPLYIFDAAAPGKTRALNSTTDAAILRGLNGRDWDGIVFWDNILPGVGA